MREKIITGNLNENPCFLRFGYVSDYDEKKHAARVSFPDKGDLVSGWLPVCAPNSNPNKYERPLNINEHVACLLSGAGIEEGIIIGAIYDETNETAKKNKEVHAITFSDGTEIFYNQAENDLTARNESGSYIKMAGGEVEIHGSSHVNITAPRIDLN